MMLNGRTVFFIALGCGLVFTPAPGLLAQGRPPAPAAGQQQAQPAAGQEPGSGPPQARTFRQGEVRRPEGRPAGVEGRLQDLAEPGCGLDHLRRGDQGFQELSNDEERDAFIEQFWLRRNPNPDSPENEFREEHYRRIAYANEHFAAGKPGWKTDRGHIYIAFGKPDSIDSHPSGGSYQPPHGRGRRRDLDLPVRDLALPLSRGHWRKHRPGVCGYLPVRRLPLHHRPQRKGCASARPRSMGRPSGKRWARPRRPTASGAAWRAWAPDRWHHRSRARSLTASNWRPRSLRRRRSSSPIWTSFISEHKLLSGPVFPFDVRTDFVKVTESIVLVPVTSAVEEPRHHLRDQGRRLQGRT